ncbi:MAG: phospholipid carrier-dependent glycosyltransferase, partial [Hymenobacter sp.]
MKETTALAQARAPRWFWPLLLGLHLLVSAPFFGLPPASVHVWRQCNTMAVARNFAEESMNILRPRVDRRNDTDGVTGMQFPSYEWLVAGSYRLLGFHEFLPRVINWLISLAGIVAFYHLVRQISGVAWLGAVGAWCLAWSPEVYYHGLNALPDILALTSYVAGLLWFARWRQAPRPAWLAASLLAITLAGLTKLQFLAAGFPMAVFVVRDVGQR